MICDPAFQNESDGYKATFSMWLNFEGRGAAIFLDLGVSAKSECPVFFASGIMLLTHVQFFFIKVIKMCCKHAPACC